MTKRLSSSILHFFLFQFHSLFTFSCLSPVALLKTQPRLQRKTSLLLSSSNFSPFGKKKKSTAVSHRYFFFSSSKRRVEKLYYFICESLNVSFFVFFWIESNQAVKLRTPFFCFSLIRVQPIAPQKKKKTRKPVVFFFFSKKWTTATLFFFFLRST